MTYTETRGYKLFDWKKALSNPVFQELDPLAEKWATDPIAQYSGIERNEYGVPLDIELSDLGCDFYQAIFLEKWSDAKTILKQIEAKCKSH